jgi:DNA recombination protein RmuC
MESELRGQLAASQAEAQRLQGIVADIGAARAASDASRVAAEQQLRAAAEDVSAARQSEGVSRDRVASLEAGLAASRAEVEAGRSRLEDQARFHAQQAREAHERHEAALRELREAGDRALAALRDQFKATAAEALASNNPRFLEMANEVLSRFKASAEGDLSQRQERIAALVKPLEEQLRSYQQRLQQAESQQQAALGQVHEQLKSLSTQSQVLSSETQRLRVVLGSNQARGRWGEETLRRVVEAAGMSAHCDFDLQVQEGDKKPDLVVRLPGERVIVVDSKVPDLDFLDALGAADEARRAEALRDHAAKLRSTIKALAERDYPRQFPAALDHVVLFVPAESLFSAALEGDRDLIVWAAEKHILLATPASLIALLRSVAVSWQQHEQSRNAQEIAAAAQELFARVAKLAEHLARIRKGLETANDAYNDAVGSYEGRVRPQGEKLARLGGGAPGKDLAEIPPVATALRLPPAGEA